MLGVRSLINTDFTVSLTINSKSVLVVIGVPSTYNCAFTELSFPALGSNPVPLPVRMNLYVPLGMFFLNVFA